MLDDRQRILELALESLENKKKQIEQEIAEITNELRGKRKTVISTQGLRGMASAKPDRKKPKFTKEEKLRRSQRMKAYWDNWRKKKARKK